MPICHLGTFISYLFTCWCASTATKQNFQMITASALFSRSDRHFLFHFSLSLFFFGLLIAPQVWSPILFTFQPHSAACEEQKLAVHEIFMGHKAMNPLLSTLLFLRSSHFAFANGPDGVISFLRLRVLGRTAGLHTEHHTNTDIIVKSIGAGGREVCGGGWTA